MRVCVLNFKKIKAFRYIFKCLTVFALIFSFTYFLVNLYIESEAYQAVLMEENDKKIIVIDAGHGGEDSGAVGASGVLEKDLNFAFAKELGALFEERGYAVVYTRTKDKLLYTEEENIKGFRKINDLKNRCKIAAEYENALFISLHMNSFSSSKYSGLQVYYTPENKQSEALANAVQSTVKSKIQAENNRKIKSGEGIYLLENTINTAILIECGFLSNPEECRKLTEKEYQKSLSFAIFCGIIEYINTNS